MEWQRGLAMRKVSVRPSNACIVTKRKKDQSIFLYHTKDNLAYFFGEKEWLMGSTPSIWNFGSTVPRWCEIADFEPIVARSASPVTPSEKSSINTRKFTTRFPLSQRWSSYVAPKLAKGAQRRKNSRFSTKIALRLTKVCYKSTKFLCVKNVCGKVVRYSLA